MSRASVHFCETVEEGWRPCPPELCEAERLWAELERLWAELDRLRAALTAVVREYELWATDANDGEFAYYKSEGLMMACVRAREALIDDECAPFPRGGM